MPSLSGVCSIIKMGLNGVILIFALISLTDRKVGCLLMHPDSNITAFLGEMWLPKSFMQRDAMKSFTLGMQLLMLL